MTQEVTITINMVKAVEKILWREFGVPSEIGSAHEKYDETSMEILESALRRDGVQYAVSAECRALSDYVQSLPDGL